MYTERTLDILREQFDAAFEDETALDVLERILNSFDIDIMAQGNRFSGLTYTGRLWEDGGQIADVTGQSLEDVLKQLDATARTLIKAYSA